MRGKGDHTPPDDMQPRPDDNTSAYVMAQVMVHAENGELIHFESAREIAAWWHSPGPADVGFSTFSHTGRITCDLVPEIARERRREAGTAGRKAARNVAALNALESYVTHAGWECPGVTDLSACNYVWSSDSGCAPHWTYSDASGTNIDGSLYAETDAAEKVLWSGPDGPDEVWRRDANGNWERES